MIRTKKAPWHEPHFWLGACALLCVWLFFEWFIGGDIFGHSPRDSFTLQALAWRKGMLSLGQDYPWLELAIYQGDYYVSFPSVPALVMWLLTFPFGGETPNTLCDLLYFLGGYMAAYHLCRRYRKPGEALFLALFFTLGCSLMDLSLTGDVWNQGQLLCFLLTTLFVLGITGDGPASWGLGLLCLALSVGCRPFQAVYVPFGLWELYRQTRARFRSIGRTLGHMLPCLIAPALVALALGWYNWARFSDPLEFGHNYLPEFTRDPELPQMGVKYISGNIQGLLRLPYIQNGRLEFPIFNGFAFYLANPLYITVFICALLDIFKKRLDTSDVLMGLGFAAEILLLLMHKTFGGWQYGARYLCDLLPVMLLFQLRHRERVSWWEYAIGGFAIAFTLYGVYIFRLIDMEKSVS